MPLFITILALLLVVAMIYAFVRNAIRLRRDVDRRFDHFRARLESEATTTLDPILKPNSADDTLPSGH